MQRPLYVSGRVLQEMSLKRLPTGSRRLALIGHTIGRGSGAWPSVPGLAKAGACPRNQHHRDVDRCNPMRRRCFVVCRSDTRRARWAFPTPSA